VATVSPSHYILNSLKAKLNPICHLLALLGAHNILHVSRIRVKLHVRLTGLSNQGIISEFFNQYKSYLDGAVKLILNVENIAFDFQITVIKILPPRVVSIIWKTTLLSLCLAISMILSIHFYPCMTVSGQAWAEHTALCGSTLSWPQCPIPNAGRSRYKYWLPG
jgi:hypothetical protein